MATGKCVNIGGGCSKALNKYVVEADKANFVCKECGKPLVSCDGQVTDPDCKSALTGTSTPTQGGDKGKRNLIIGVGILAVLGMGGAAAYFLLNKEEIHMPESIQLSSTRQELLEGDIDTLKVTNTPIDYPATYTWTSSNEKVAKVDSNGVVTMTGEGQATILVTAVENAAAKDSCIYTVTESMDEGIVDVESMTFMETEKDMQLKAGEEKQLNIDCSPGNANEMVSWESEDTNIATVGNDGMVKAVASGSTTITAVTDRTGTKASIKVTVAKEQIATSGLHLSGRIWEGPTANGKPHGIGVMKFTSTQVIDSRDPNKTMANKGDYLTGAKYDNGKLVQGQLHRTDGTQKAIVIGQ